MTRPILVTFTGLDDKTDLVRARDIAQRWPVEWGVLFSRSSPFHRFPTEGRVRAIEHAGLPRLSAHLCGAYSREVMDSGIHTAPMDTSVFQRMQVNYPRYPHVTKIAQQADEWKLRGIGQSRNAIEHPPDTRIDWLFDQSGGAGVVPKLWPKYDGRYVGYAGGITPENVLTILADIGATGPYWIDMENGVRDDHDWLDLDKCEAVCKTVFE